MVSVRLCLGAVFVVSLVPSSESVMCYLCDSASVSGVVDVGSPCNDPFSVTPGTWTGYNCSGTFCVKQKASVGGVMGTKRGCAVGNGVVGCDSVGAFGINAEDCTCDTDYCNGMAKMAPSLLVLVLALISQI